MHILRSDLRLEPADLSLVYFLSFYSVHLQALVSIHGERGGMAEGFLSPEETSIIQGALDLTSLTARHAMTPLDKVGWRLASRRAHCCDEGKPLRAPAFQRTW